MISPTSPGWTSARFSIYCRADGNAEVNTSLPSREPRSNTS
jgi:hypothetical protein